MATILRHTVPQVGMARQVSEGRQTKIEVVYQYLIAAANLLIEANAVNATLAALAGRFEVSVP